MQAPPIETEASLNKQNKQQRKQKVFACIPAYNQEQSIERVVQNTLKHVEHVIVIDDGSFDRTTELAEKAGAIVIRHPMNMGYGAAVKSGFTKALQGNVDIVVTLDADLQHNPDDIPSLLTPILDGKAEIVIGSRTNEKGGKMPAYRKAGVGFITKLVQYNGAAVKDAQSGYRAYSAKSLRTILPNLSNSGFGMITESLAEASRYDLPLAEVPVVIRYDTGMKTSTKHPVSHGVGVVYSIVYYIAERRPLLILGLPGIIFLAVGIGSLARVLELFNESGEFAVGTGVLAIGAAVVGVLLLVVALILAVLSRMSNRISDMRRSDL
ncbi:MAG: glycosyltransferase family 2 protein, partial [Nitrososphaerales archaeon]